MSSYVTNKVIIKGSKEQILAMLNYGIKRRKMRPHKEISSACKAIKDTLDTKQPFTLRSFLPMPKTFLKNDTENEYFKHIDAARYQKRKYGVVGWYCYNIKTLGTNYDNKFTDISFEEVNDKENYIIFSVTTFNTPPIMYCEYIMNKFNVRVFLGSIELENNICFAQEIKGTYINFDEDLDNIQEFISSDKFDEDTEMKMEYKLFKNLFQTLLDLAHDEPYLLGM